MDSDLLQNSDVQAYITVGFGKYLIFSYFYVVKECGAWTLQNDLVKCT